MGIAGWGWDRNWVRRGRVTAGSQVVGLDVGKLQNDQGSRTEAWQTVGTTSWFQVDALASVHWQVLVLARTNLTPQATVRWRVSDDPSFTTWEFDSGFNPGPAAGLGQTVAILPAIPPDYSPDLETIEAENGQVIRAEDEQPLVSNKPPAGGVGLGLGRYLRCDISDPTNPDGYLNIPLAYAGPLTQTAINIGWGGGTGRVHGSTDVRTRGGALFSRLNWAARVQEIEHTAILESEVWPIIMALDLYARRGGNVLFVPDPDSPEVARETIFGRLTPTANLTFPYQSDERRAWRATIEERL